MEYLENHFRYTSKHPLSHADHQADRRSTGAMILYNLKRLGDLK